MKHWYSRLERRQVVVNTRDGHSYRGYISDGDRHSVLLTSAEYLSQVDGEAPVVLQGVVVILRENVSTVQIPKAGA